MMELNARAFYGAINALRHMETVIANRKTDVEVTPDGGAKITGISDPVFIQSIAETVDNLERELNVLQATLTLLEVHRLQRVLGLDFVTWEDLSRAATEIRSRLADELSLRTVLVLQADRQRYFKPSEPLFGPDFATGFPTQGVHELDEAAKCLALDRPTAAVFHLMRVMEVGIRSVARCLGIPDPLREGDRNWGAMLRVIKVDLDARVGASHTKTWARKDDKEFFEVAYASLDAVRVAWRNPTMHVENRYTDDEAEHIFVAVRGFMKKLASRCDEEGNPRA